MLDVHSYMARQACADEPVLFKLGMGASLPLSLALKGCKPRPYTLQASHICKIPACLHEVFYFMCCVLCSVVQLCPNICDPIDCGSQPCPSVHRILFYSPRLNFLVLIWIFFSSFFSAFNLLPCIYS